MLINHPFAATAATLQVTPQRPDDLRIIVEDLRAFMSSNIPAAVGLPTRPAPQHVPMRVSVALPVSQRPFIKLASVPPSSSSLLNRQCLR